ncbi:hypothetical protein BU17DRAFT_53515, partial [Hysterangium stoloniferum]
ARQELCESLNYFRSYQGGVYSNNKRARGYLLDGHPAAHDLWHEQGKCIISHGCVSLDMALYKNTGKSTLVEDQTVTSPSCAALVSSWLAKEPVVLIAGSGYELFPFNIQPPMEYVVLGYYVINHAWEPERSPLSSKGYFVRWKFQFRWIESQGKPWWITEDVYVCPVLSRLCTVETLKSRRPMFMAPDVGGKSELCQYCQRRSMNIYRFGWVCTNSGCKSFFCRRDNEAPSPGGYDTKFLTVKPDLFAFSYIPLNIRPELPVVRQLVDGMEQSQVATLRPFWKGFWCEKCGRLSCREYWTHWECLNCHYEYRIKASLQTPQPVPVRLIQKPTYSQNAGITERISIFRDGQNTFRCTSYIFPFSRGTVHLVRANVSAEATANDILKQYQVDARDNRDFFRRYSMKTVLKGRMLSHYFSQNSGAPYAYVGGTDNTVELDKFNSVSQSLAFIRKRVSTVLGRETVFNEILSAAYMEDQKMEYHSDGEKDLGPVVAALSLGAGASMKFRPVPTKWREANDGVKSPKKPPNVIELTLYHGDVLIMDGLDIQEYYQHAVHPSGFRIAATARYIEIKSDFDGTES